jgi:plastocyanin
MSVLTRRLLALTAVVLLPLAACGDGEPAEPATGAGGTTVPTGVDLSDKDFEDLSADAEVTVQARDNSFVAPYIEVKAGTKITFSNRGRNQHDVFPVVEGAFPEIPIDAFDPGASKTLTFDEAGEYPYYCTLHGSKTKGMVGAIRVVG